MLTSIVGDEVVPLLLEAYADMLRLRWSSSHYFDVAHLDVIFVELGLQGAALLYALFSFGLCAFAVCLGELASGLCAQAL